MEKSKKDVSQSTENALKLLDCFILKEEWGISELSRELDLGKASVSRIIGALENKKYIIKDYVTGKYRLGYKLLLFGSLCKDRNELTKAFAPTMKKISEKYQATTHLSIFSGNDLLILNKISEGPMVYMNSRVGGTLPVFASASGKCLLAFSNDDWKEKCLKHLTIEKFTKYTIKNKNELINELNKIQENGFAIDDEETYEGLYCIAVPVFDYNGNAIAAISVSGSKVKQKPRLKEVVSDLNLLANILD